LSAPKETHRDSDRRDRYVLLGILMATGFATAVLFPMSQKAGRSTRLEIGAPATCAPLAPKRAGSTPKELKSRPGPKDSAGSKQAPNR